MKRKIVVGLLLQTAVFLVGGLYLASRIGSATDDVDRIVQLHQVEQLRERYLRQLEGAQSDLVRSQGTGAFPVDLDAMHSAVRQCAGCHHSAESTRRLDALTGQTERYRGALALVSAEAPGSEARRARREAAYRAGEDLIARVRDMIDRTTRSLEQHTLVAMAAVSRTKYVAYGLVVLGPLLSGLLGLVWIRSLTRPLDALLDATRKLEKGELGHRVEGLRDEFAHLAAAFNTMASSIEEQLELLQRSEQLVVAGELAAGLVHEIKNPLAGIKGAVQVLSREAQMSREDRAILDKVGREVVSLEAILRSFLEFAKPARPQLTDVDVNGVVESVVAFYMRGHALKPGRPIRIGKVLGPVPPARLDPMQLQQILLNLLLNAVDAMPAGGEVAVRTAWDGDSGGIHIDVADRGRGISTEHAGRIFRPFFTTKPGGTGLGLAVSKRLIEQHGGSLSFLPNAGGGTVFRIQLPAAQHVPARVA